MKTITPAEFRELEGPRPPKYGNKKTTYNGCRYDSKAEAAVAQELDLRVAAGELLSWERQSLVRVFWPGTEVRILTARLDFRLHWPGGRVSYLEVKGYIVRDWPIRERILRASGLDLEVRRRGSK